MRPWLEKDDAYTNHGPDKIIFAHNPYSVNNVMDVWECDLVEAQSLGRSNDN